MASFGKDGNGEVRGKKPHEIAKTYMYSVTETES